MDVVKVVCLPGEAGGTREFNDLYKIQPTEDTTFYSVGERAMEILYAGVQGESALWQHPKGHRRDMGPFMTDHIEAFFTAGLENVGGPCEGFPLHGTLSLTPATYINRVEDADGRIGIGGQINATNMVHGPYIKAGREVTVSPGIRAFRVSDALTADVDSDYMLLYHPNFPVVEGTRIVANPLAVVARNRVSSCDIERYGVFENVGRGYARIPVSEPAVVDRNLSWDQVRAENFERCYVMQMQPDSEGDVYVALVAPDGGSAAFVRYNQSMLVPGQGFQLWKNPRGGVCGLEPGHTFNGRTWATDKGLVGHLKAGESHTFAVDVGFLRGEREVRNFIGEHDLGSTNPELIVADGQGPGYTHSQIQRYYKQPPR